MHLTVAFLDELKRYLQMSKPKIVFCAQIALEKLQEIQKEFNFVERVILLDNCSGTTLTIEDLLSDTNSKFEFETIDDLDNHVAFICHSSGTTGLPKGAMISHANIRLNLCHSE